MLVRAVLGCAVLLAWLPCGSAAEKPEGVREAIAAAQQQGDEAAVRHAAADGVRLLGDHAGVPEVPDEVVSVPSDARPVEPSEIAAAFEPYLKEIRARRRWRIGENPPDNEHKPREVASVLSGCLAARRAGCRPASDLLALACEASDYLRWTQTEGGTGVFPFPARRKGGGKVFDIAARALARAEAAGTIDGMVRRGWVIDDRAMDPGGLQFDNALSGVAMFELFEATGDTNAMASARAAADWAAGRTPVPNWNYNSFSVYLLAEGWRTAHEPRWRDAAKRIARLGVYPGQLATGPRAGRWADPHNARPAYHYIIVRALTSLVSALEPDDPDRAMALEVLQRALRARNPDFAGRGIVDVNSALEALALLPLRLPESAFAGTGSFEALNILGGAAAARARRGAVPCDPVAWGRYLESRARSAVNTGAARTSIRP